MFSPELEKRWRGMLLGQRTAETVVKAYIDSQIEAEVKEHGDAPKLPGMPKDLGRRRAIVRAWPRDPKGPMITTLSSDPKGPTITTLPAGKQAANGFPLWGATVLDFFWVQRAPEIVGWMTAANSSRLLAWAKEIDELEHAKEEIAWAEREENPKELFPCDMATLLRDADYGLPGAAKLRDDMHKLPNGRMSAARYQKFQNRLPLHLLPEKLIVHDPDSTLRVGRTVKVESEECDTPRVYKLELTKESRDAIAAARRTALAQSPEKRGSDLIYTTQSEDMITGNVKEGPVIEATAVILPPPPPPALLTPEAHLYINAADKLGEGNHSHVYRVAWEIPRSLVMEPYVCDKCIAESLFKKLREEAPGAKLSTSESLDFQIEELMIHIAGLHGRKGKLTTVEVTMPDVDVELVYSSTGKSEKVSQEGEYIVNMEYEGSVRKVSIDVKWSTPGNFCEHENERSSAPTTFKVDVSAKLSHKYDEHLPREAQNYQKFPAHFFQHWSGYNIIPPNKDPTPVLAVVPQFYGYYVPEDGQVKDGEYLSPILLLENCGTPVDVDDLSIDDRHECASLLLRMHAEGWLHNSFFPRNVLMQYGDITEWPVFQEKKDRRFRIIDFGRSVLHPKPSGPSDYGNQRFREEHECRQTFKINDF